MGKFSAFLKIVFYNNIYTYDFNNGYKNNYN